jgi:hypothetical protein
MITFQDRRRWAAVTLLISLSGCFSPQQPACAFSCVAPPGRCPQDYACGHDGLCHRAGADSASCALTPPIPADAGSDLGGSNDAPAGDQSAGNEPD